MGRKTILLSEVEKTLSISRQGKYSKRVERKKIMRAIVNDLMKVKRTPRSFHTFSDEQLTGLIKRWKARGNNLSTISNKLGVLRGYLKLINIDYSMPNNKTLGLTKRVTRMRPLPVVDIREQVFHPITGNLLDLQILFGLTKTESMKLRVSLFRRESELHIHRSIAYNSKDRIIPIITDQQHAAIKERVVLDSTHDSLKKPPNYRELNVLYQYELRFFKIDPLVSFRQFYIKSRFDDLLEDHSDKAALIELRAETGIQSLTRLRRLLRE